MIIVTVFDFDVNNRYNINNTTIPSTVLFSYFQLLNLGPMSTIIWYSVYTKP